MAITRNRLKLALGLTTFLFFGVLTLLLLSLYGCAARYTPTGGTQPATTFEQILAWNTTLAEANEALASNIVTLEQAGLFNLPEARNILYKQGAIAQADRRITSRITSASECATKQAGANATAAKIDAAAAACLKLSGGGIADDINLILGAIRDLNNGMLLGIKDPVKRQAVSDLLTTIGTLTSKIYDSLTTTGAVKKAEVHTWRPSLS